MRRGILALSLALGVFIGSTSNAYAKKVDVNLVEDVERIEISIPESIFLSILNNLKIIRNDKGKIIQITINLPNRPPIIITPRPNQPQPVPAPASWLMLLVAAATLPIIRKKPKLT